MTLKKNSICDYCGCPEPAHNDKGCTFHLDCVVDLYATDDFDTDEDFDIEDSDSDRIVDEVEDEEWVKDLFGED